MKQKYYKLPVRLEKLFEGDIRQLERCSELESIDQHIELLLTTCPGEHRFDPKYGCRIWELDFERIVSTEQWKELFTGYVCNRKNFLTYDCFVGILYPYPFFFIFSNLLFIFIV